MKIQRCRSLIVVGCIGAAMLAAPAASAQPPGGAPAGKPDQKNLEEAKSRYSKGLQLYDDGAYDAARVQFERAYELAPSYRILYNIGLVYKQLNEFVGSLKALQQYLAEGGAEVPEDRKAEVTKLIESLKGIIAFATVTVNVPGAEISVDDKAVGKSPIDTPIQLNPGRRKISAKIEGRLPDAKVIEVASGDKAPVSLKLDEAKKTIINKGGDFKPIVAWIVTGAFAVGAGVTGYLTLGANSDIDDKKAVFGGATAPAAAATRQEFDDLESKRNTFALVTDILLIGTVLSAGVATYFTFFAPKDKGGDEKKDEAPPKAAGLKIRPTVGGLVGTF